MSNQAEQLKKELLSLQEKRKQLEDEILMHRVVLQNVSPLFAFSCHCRAQSLL